MDYLISFYLCKTSSWVKSIILFLLFYFSFAQNVFSQNFHQTIRGTVKDIETQKNVEAAIIQVLNTNPLLQAITNEKGEYRIDSVPVGRYEIRIFCLGFEDKIVSNWLIKTGKESVLAVELQSALVNLKAVEVKAQKGTVNEMITVSGRTFSAEDTKRYPATLNDPSRMAMSYAGVTSGYDRDNEIIIRGNAAKGLLWMLEGIEVPSPNHFSGIGSSTGAVSMLSGTMLANSDFITGAFPAEYGNATSGVFDIKLRNGNNEKREYTFQAGFLGLDAALEGPFKKGKQASYIANYRYSSTSIFNLLGAKIQGDAVPQFQDFSFKLSFPTQKAGIFNVYGLAGSSDITQKLNDRKEGYSYNLGTVGLSHHYILNDRNYVKSIISVHHKNMVFKSLKTNRYKETEDYKSDFKDAALNVAVNLTSKINSKNTIKTGIQYHHINYDYFTKTIYTYSNNKSQADIHMDETDHADQNQAYVSWKYRINNRLSLINGVHFLQLSLNKKYSIEPRSAIKYQLTNSQSLSAAFGIHSRIEPFKTYMGKSVLNGDTAKRNQYLDFTKARHYVLSYENSINQNLFLKAEIYYQQLYDVPISPDTASKYSTLNYESTYYSGQLVNWGTGRNYGIEITVDKKISQGYFFLVTASFFESTYKAADKVERNTLYNANYVSNYIIGREFWIGEKRKNMINTNIRVNWAGGKRYTPIDLAESRKEGYEITDRQHYFSSQYEDYFRIDIQIGYIRNHLKYTSELRLDIQNVTNRRNLFNMYYDDLTEQVERSYQLGIIPILSYKVEF